MIKETNNDEIDIGRIILTLWDYKIKIITITTAFLILGFVYFNSLSKNLIAITKIKPVSIFEIQKYDVFDKFPKILKLNKIEDLQLSQSEKQVIETADKGISFDIIEDEINSKILLDLFINKIQTKELVEKGIIESKLINKDNFQKKESYEEAIQKKITSIIDRMTPPTTEEDKSYWKYNFSISEKNKKNWMNFLKYMEKHANEEIRLFLLESFNKKIEEYNAKLEYKLEDIEIDIQNALAEYQITIKKRLAFLKEQSEIARTLDIAKNELQVEDFYGSNNILTNVKTGVSYYLKGYEMIDKEINLINSRKNDKLFVSSLIELEKSKLRILKDKTSERLKSLFLKAPINNADKFIAGNIDYISTVYKSEKQPLSKILVISFLIGLSISFITIFLNILITSRK
jgi:LPS O-antigen subunit length determinant protein (WzzB/FepE family)